jgi:hypothetical protein
VPEAGVFRHALGKIDDAIFNDCAESGLAFGREAQKAHVFIRLFVVRSSFDRKYLYG